MSQFPNREEILESELRSKSFQLEASYLVGSKMINYLLKQLGTKLTKEEMVSIKKKLEEIARDDLQTKTILSMADNLDTHFSLFEKLGRVKL